MRPAGQLAYVRSPVDGLLHPCAICATDETDEPKPLIVEVSPGAITDLPGAVGLTEEIAAIAMRAGRACVVLRPTGRGPGSVYQNYGEIDVLEAIEFAASHYSIDRDRITVTGASMGGAASWYLATHYPDLFAAAAPFCGYADHRLWEKPGGSTFQLRAWEEPSWRARSSAFLVENLEHTPVWMVHGEWDRAVGGGVSVEQSRQMARLLGELGYQFTYTELARTGHDCRPPELWQQVVLWLLDQRKARDPAHVSLATYTLRHSRSYWIAVEQLARYGERALVDASVSGGLLTIRTQNVRTLSAGPLSGREAVAVTLDGGAAGTLDLTRGQTFRREATGSWTAGSFDLSAEKRVRSSGPLGDLFFDGTLLVVGTTGSEAETFFNDWAAHDAAAYYRARNGGVHRGGILGQNTIDLPVVRDVELTESERTDKNLVLYGTPASNAVLAASGASLAVAFAGHTVQLSDRTYRDPFAAAFAVFPHPRNPDRYVAIHGGVAPDAICWGSHLDLGLLPDYLVYARGEVLDWGFWGNDWRSQR